MGHIKKFSMIKEYGTSIDSILESSNITLEELESLVKSMGYDSIDEIKREKSLLSKLESLLKEFKPKADNSEDRAEEIEDDINKKGEEKSLEDKEVGVDDEESGIDIEEEEDTPAATRRIMSFEDFIKEKEVTVNKNVKYHDDDEEPEDYAEPIAASANPSTVVVNEKVTKIKVWDGYAGPDEDGFELLNKLKPNDNVQFIAGDIDPDELDIETAVMKVKDAKKLFDSPHNEAKVNESAISEKEINTEDEFREYATKLLKKAHGDGYDEAKAKATIDGLKSKYSGDYGAMVGALQSSMG